MKTYNFYNTLTQFTITTIDAKSLTAAKKQFAVAFPDYTDWDVCCWS